MLSLLAAWQAAPPTAAGPLWSLPEHSEAQKQQHEKAHSRTSSCSIVSTLSTECMPVANPFNHPPYASAAVIDPQPTLSPPPSRSCVGADAHRSALLPLWPSLP
jgi:hypothetical protein